MTEHYDLSGARKRLGDAVHALAGRTSTHLDRDTLDRDALDRQHRQACDTIDRAHDDALTAMRSKIQAAAKAGTPWTLAQVTAETEQIARRHQHKMTGQLIRHEQAIVAASCSVAYGESLLDQLRNFTSAKTGQSKSKPGSMIPVQVDALDLLTTIDRQTAIWCTDPGTTADRLHWLADRQYRPQDAPDIVECATRIEGWTVEARQIIDPPPRLSLAMPCPECGTRTVYRPDSGGDVVRQPALAIADEGCRCQHCRTLWPPEAYRLLAKVLQLPDPEGVVDAG